MALQGDVILVGLRDYQDEKADVILKCVIVPMQDPNTVYHVIDCHLSIMNVKVTDTYTIVNNCSGLQVHGRRGT